MISPVTATLNNVTPNTATIGADPSLPVDERALLQIDLFAAYISTIIDQRGSSEAKDQAIEKAAQLFLPESTVEVTLARRSGSRRYSVRQYLTQLKLLPYQSTRINWVQTQFVRDLMQNPEKSYSGAIAEQQLFSNYDADGKTTYTDLMPRNVHISLDHYQRSVPEQRNGSWRVLLGNIRVEVD